VIPFGPLKQGGLVRARIVTDDALAADTAGHLAPADARQRWDVAQP
jgi:hypothetical protein